MDNPTANESHVPCQSWADQTGWSTASTQGPLLNPLSSSQHLSLGSSSDRRPPCDHLQASNQRDCLSDVSTLSSRSNTHHASLYKASHISSNLSSTVRFANSTIPSVSHTISYAEQNPHSSSMLLAANQGKNIPPPSFPQTNRPQHQPLLSPHDPYKTSFQPPLTDRGLQDVSISLQSCGQDSNQGSQRTSQANFEGVNVESGVAGYTHSHSSTSQEQPQWIPSSHCRGDVNKAVSDAAAHHNKHKQKENITSTVSNERSRSLVLHQRALLLKQVVELDKLFTSKDHTNNKMQSRTPSVTYQVNEEEETTGIKMGWWKKEETSVESDDGDPDASVKSDDSDPDYSPNSNGDFVNCLPDADSSSLDESSHSCPSTPREETPPQKSPLPRKRKHKSRGSQNNGKHKWEDAEVCAVERHMMRFIQGHKVPQKNDCLQCLEAEPKALSTRSWKGVKDYVRNRITALKRQSGNSQALYTNSNWPGQSEPQRTGHFQQF
ncbi:hypothetical protein PAMP_021868 [Pampus punctatissimus]